MNVITTVDLLRHGLPVGGEIFRGSTDVPLSDEGFVQMRAAVAKLHNSCSGAKSHEWQQIISSPLQRCSVFAQEIAAAQGVVTLIDNDLREMSFGDWDGQTLAAVKAHSAGLFANFWRDPIEHTPPNAEPMAQFCQRVSAAFWQNVLAYKGQSLLMVAHGGVIRAILGEVLQSPAASLLRYDVPYASISRIHIYHEGDRYYPQLVFHNR